MPAGIILSNRLRAMQEAAANFGDSIQGIREAQQKAARQAMLDKQDAETHTAQMKTFQNQDALQGFALRKAGQDEQDASALRSNENELSALDSGLTPFGPRMPADETPSPFLDQNRNLRARLLASIETAHNPEKPVRAQDILDREDMKKESADLTRKQAAADLEKTVTDTAFKKMDTKRVDVEIKKIQAEIDRLAKGGVDSDKIAQIEGNLRQTFETQTKPFVVVRDAFNRIQAVKDSPAGDVALIYGFMKINDPGASVMEGDIANAKNAAGVPERIRTAYNNALDGRSLDPKTRADFIGQASSLYNAQKKVYDSTKASIQNLATRYGVDPERSTFDLTGGVTSDSSAGAGLRSFKTAREALAAGLPAGTRVMINGEEAEM